MIFTQEILEKRDKEIEAWCYDMYKWEEPWPGFLEILKLEKMLKDAGIPYTKKPKAGGWIIVYDGLNYRGDAIEHWGSYGRDEDLLEIMGFDIDPKEWGDEVIGYLTAKQAFEFFKRAWDEKGGKVNG